MADHIPIANLSAEKRLRMLSDIYLQQATEFTRDPEFPHAYLHSYEYYKAEAASCMLASILLKKGFWKEEGPDSKAYKEFIDCNPYDRMDVAVLDEKLNPKLENGKVVLEPNQITGTQFRSALTTFEIFKDSRHKNLSEEDKKLMNLAFFGPNALSEGELKERKAAIRDNITLYNKQVHARVIVPDRVVATQAKSTPTITPTNDKTTTPTKTQAPTSPTIKTSTPTSGKASAASPDSKGSEPTKGGMSFVAPNSDDQYFANVIEAPVAKSPEEQALPAIGLTPKHMDEVREVSQAWQDPNLWNKLDRPAQDNDKKLQQILSKKPSPEGGIL